jgi:hypothetical protein
VEEEKGERGSERKEGKEKKGEKRRERGEGEKENQRRCKRKSSN